MVAWLDVSLQHLGTLIWVARMPMFIYVYTWNPEKANFKWMFGETTISQVENSQNPIEIELVLFFRNKF